MMVFYSLIFVLVSASVVTADSVTPTNQLEEQILLLLNKWREGAVETALFPLPSLKNIDISGVDSNYNGRGIKVTFSIGNMKLTGLDKFSVEYLNVSQTDDLHVSAKFFLPVLSLSSESYKLKGRAYIFYPLQGSGKMRLSIRNVQISLHVLFSNINDISTRIKDFLLEFSIGNVEANLENSSWPINQVLNREGVDVIQGYHDDIVKVVWDYAVPYANDYLANITPKEFLKIITDMNTNSFVVYN